MTVVEDRHIHSKCLLPLLLTVLVFFVSHGISASNFSISPEAGLAKLQTAKQHALIVIKGQPQSQSRVHKAAPYFDLAGNVDVIDRPSFHLPPLNEEPHAAVSAPDSTFPARAPPV